MKCINPQVHEKTIIWLHGLGASGDDFIPVAQELKLPDQHQMKCLFPDAPIRPITLNGGMVMPGWYDIYSLEDRSDQDEAGVIESAEHIQSLIQAEIDSGIESSNIYLAGFSQGGAIALYAGLTFDKPLAGVLALSTYLPIHSVFEENKNPVNQHTPILMMHGDQDDIIPLAYAKESFDLLKAEGYDIDWKTYPMDHSLCYEQLEDLRNWF